MGVKVDYQNKLAVQDLDTIYITGGGFVRRAFKGVSRDSVWGWEEPVWGGNLTRSTDFVLTNIDDVDFGLVARCEISYKYMNVQDYIDLMKISKERTVKVDYFNREKGERVTQEMAFTGNELGKLHAYGTEYLGVFDIKIKLVATNREKAELIQTTFTVSYNSNGGSGSISSVSKKWADSVTLSDGAGFTKSGYHIAYWATKDTNGNYDRYYEKSQLVTIWENLSLYAIWEAN